MPAPKRTHAPPKAGSADREPVVESPSLKAVYAQARKLARKDISILIRNISRAGPVATFSPIFPLGQC